ALFVVQMAKGAERSRSRRADNLQIGESGPEDVNQLGWMRLAPCGGGSCRPAESLLGGRRYGREMGWARRLPLRDRDVAREPNIARWQCCDAYVQMVSQWLLTDEWHNERHYENGIL